MIETGAELGCCRTRLYDNEVDAEGSDFLADGLDEPFDPPLVA